jgi:hypothetical protein
MPKRTDNFDLLKDKMLLQQKVTIKNCGKTMKY